MYEYLEGTIAELTPAYAVVDVGGVGYMVNISLGTYSHFEHAERGRFYVHYVVREDAQLLYGFATKSERELFRLLIGVSGVGGGTARMILSTYSPDELSSIIRSENAPLLKNVKGLGLKTAQKIIVDLRDKVLGIDPSAESAGKLASASAGSELFNEALAALAMLGFARSSSEKTVLGVIKDNPTASVEQVIKLSLKKL